MFSCVALVVCGCANTKAYENFKNVLNSKIGLDINPVIRNSLSIGETIQVIELPNGNQEYRSTMQYIHGGHGPCTSIYEVDSKTQKITRVDFVGSEHDCIIPL